ncbi:MAG: RlmE family RNA methyltransferase [Acetobacterales bacterium]
MARDRDRDKGVKQRVKTARGRKPSSTRWLQRQLNDPYVAQARASGYRSRAAFKLAELDDKLKILKPGKRVVDLGAAPGGWAQIAVERVGAGRPGAPLVVAVDIAEMEPVQGAAVLRLDMLEPGTEDAIREALGGAPDIVLSDMSPSTTGHAATDHIRIVALVEAALDFACAVLAPGGTFVAKVFRGGTEASLLDVVKRRFDRVRHVKPAASRQESPEIYLVATGFRPNSGMGSDGGSAGDSGGDSGAESGA